MRKEIAQKIQKNEQKKKSKIILKQQNSIFNKKILLLMINKINKGFNYKHLYQMAGIMNKQIKGSIMRLNDSKNTLVLI